MKKTIICVAVILAMCFPININAFADNTAMETKINTHEALEGKIVDPYGNTYKVEGRIVESERTSFAMTEHSGNTITYAFDIYSNGTSLSAILPNSSDATDYTYQSTVTLTINYNASTDYPAEFLLTSVSGNWTIDDSRVSVISGTLNYACTDYDNWEQSVTYYLSSSDLQNKSFYKNTNFTEYIGRDFGGFLGATLTLNYLMGDSRTWSFTVENIRFNNPYW